MNRPLLVAQHTLIFLLAFAFIPSITFASLDSSNQTARDNDHEFDTFSEKQLTSPQDSILDLGQEVIESGQDFARQARGQLETLQDDWDRILSFLKQRQLFEDLLLIIVAVVIIILIAIGIRKVRNRRRSKRDDEGTRVY